jgi:hypothetical protein
VAGALISMVSTGLILLLLMTEFYSYSSTKLISELYIDEGK